MKARAVSCWGGFLRPHHDRADRDDLAKLPFSDDVTPESRLLMRRNLKDRVSALAPFLTYESDPYIVLATMAVCPGSWTRSHLPTVIPTRPITGSATI